MATRRASETARKAASTPRQPRFPRTVRTAIEAARAKKAENIVVLDLRTAGGFTDYFVLCTGASARQIGAISESVQESLEDTLDERPAGAEGGKHSEWVLLDYFNFVVHIFSRECRGFYDLERLWGAAVRYDLSDAEA